jgi:GNAT superfamily N-acetyltransferase
VKPPALAIHRDLVASGLLVPVGGAAEERLFLDCELASLAENRLGDRLDPRVLPAARRAAWATEATTERQTSLQARRDYESCYWIAAGGERVGTAALDHGGLGGARIRLASFYVFPSHRGQGVGSRALGRIVAAAGRHDHALWLDTSWTWQRAVRFYLRAGMWIYMWKRDLTFFGSPRLPAPRIDVGDRVATLDVLHGGRRITLARAHRDGADLEIDEPDKALERHRELGDAAFFALSTLSLGLALSGWPLVRSAEQWERCRAADGGPPEALAYKITLWEAWDKQHGWRVETPRIPGLEYPTWAQIQARWDDERRAIIADGTIVVEEDEDDDDGG